MNQINRRSLHSLAINFMAVPLLVAFSVGQQDGTSQAAGGTGLVLDYVVPQQGINRTPEMATVGHGVVVPESVRRIPSFPRPRWTLIKRVTLWRLTGNRLQLKVQMAAPIKPQPGDRFVVEVYVPPRDVHGRMGIVFPLGYTYGSVPPLRSGKAGVVVDDFDKEQFVLLGQVQAQLNRSKGTLVLTFNAALTGDLDGLRMVLTRYLPRTVAFNAVPGDVAEGIRSMVVLDPNLTDVNRPISIGIPDHPSVNAQ